jgi:S1-C subfamily serine protease
VLTVAHGVAGQLSNTVTTTSGEILNAKVVAIDIEMDLAILSIQHPYAIAALKPISFGKVDRNSKIKFVVFQNSEQVVRRVVFKRNLRIKTKDIYLKRDVSRPSIEVETKVVVGNSGGPLINENGEIVGIVWSTSRTVKNRSWATRIEAANELLSRVSTDNPSTQSSQVVACVG